MLHFNEISYVTETCEWPSVLYFVHDDYAVESGKEAGGGKPTPQ
jgi:hypothetical protein